MQQLAELDPGFVAERFALDDVQLGQTQPQQAHRRRSVAQVFGQQAGTLGVAGAFEGSFQCPHQACLKRSEALAQFEIGPHQAFDLLLLPGFEREIARRLPPGAGGRRLAAEIDRRRLREGRERCLNDSVIGVFQGIGQCVDRRAARQQAERGSDGHTRIAGELGVGQERAQPVDDGIGPGTGESEAGRGSDGGVSFAKQVYEGIGQVLVDELGQIGQGTCDGDSGGIVTTPEDVRQSPGSLGPVLEEEFSGNSAADLWRSLALDESD